MTPESFRPDTPKVIVDPIIFEPEKQPSLKDTYSSEQLKRMGDHLKKLQQEIADLSNKWISEENGMRTEQSMGDTTIDPNKLRTAAVSADLYSRLHGAFNMSGPAVPDKIVAMIEFLEKFRPEPGSFEEKETLKVTNRLKEILAAP